jgi:hypothetical protein
MTSRWRIDISSIFIFAVFAVCTATRTLSAQQPDGASVIQGIDAAVKARVDNVAGYTVTEHYAVFRGQDETHPVAEMLVKTTYAKGTGKSYTVLSKSGSALIAKFVLDPLLENERTINLPGNVEHAWITSGNYQMKLKADGAQPIDGRQCLLLTIEPRRKAPNLIEGTLWVDANDYSIVKIQGTATKSPSFLTGAAEVSRQYANIDGYSMATHAKATSKSSLLGQTVIKIDYKDYQFSLITGKSASVNP